MAERKAISKRLRFEVFKRDSFTCQYCGKSAPDVVLHIDHIVPVKEGGKNDITNLVCSCESCNMGKGAIKLSDDSAVKKEKKQLDELNEKREQLELMMKWKKELLTMDDKQFKFISEEFRRCTDRYYLMDCMKPKVRQWIKKFGFEKVFDVIATSCEQYLQHDKEGTVTQESANKALDYIPKICYCQAKQDGNGDDGQLFYLRGIMRNRFDYCDERKAIIILKDLYKRGFQIDELKQMILCSKNWSEWKRYVDDAYETC